MTTATDTRLLIRAASLSNREVAAALGMTDDRLIRRWKSGVEKPSPEKGNELIGLAADALAAQLLRALEIAADGRVEIARLEGIERFSAVTALALRAAFIARLMQRGLKIERDDT